MKDHYATLVAKREVAQATFEMVLELDAHESILPGQFAHIQVEGAFLRRPISVAGYDPVTQCVRIIVQQVGPGSKALTSMQVGGKTKILAPAGNLFPLDQGNWVGSLWLVGGGIGVAPLLYVAEYLRRKKNEDVRIRSFLGFRGPEQAFDVETFATYGETAVATSGFVTDMVVDALKTERPDRIFACGPTPFMKTLQGICEEYSLDAFASLEEHMGCGVGACLVCNCTIRVEAGTAYRRVCCDGPVFPLHQVVFP